MDKVFIEQLEVSTSIGVYDWEQKIKQKLVLDIEMAYDNRLAGRSDNIVDALDYSKVNELISTHIESGRFFLIERVAEEVAELVMAYFSVSWIRIRLLKLGVIPKGKGAGVVIERSKRRM
ncbi:dihydroneopterin aldolase [Candidatus Photodesmus blepharus]|uniref:7,8-dihydroneopterin aldolase n=1 Tax=Candidatus Photodesmus blepharonis TaxID=1179155 RepID=A0A084CMR6_9GAMM|nr:dihydroneopterin aldolase [Candidatus Photodesmus blepharus]KEY91095.1 dihydroneopterin aldolase [Candidatus Photodesmus blepharus]